MALASSLVIGLSVRDDNATAQIQKLSATLKLGETSATGMEQALAILAGGLTRMQQQSGAVTNGLAQTASGMRTTAQAARTLTEQYTALHQAAAQQQRVGTTPTAGLAGATQALQQSYQAAQQYSAALQTTSQRLTETAFAGPQTARSFEAVRSAMQQTQTQAASLRTHLETVTAGLALSGRSGALTAEGMRTAQQGLALTTQGSDFLDAALRQMDQGLALVAKGGPEAATGIRLVREAVVLSTQGTQALAQGLQTLHTGMQQTAADAARQAAAEKAATEALAQQARAAQAVTAQYQSLAASRQRLVSLGTTPESGFAGARVASTAAGGAAEGVQASVRQARQILEGLQASVTPQALGGLTQVLTSGQQAAAGLGQQLATLQQGLAQAGQGGLLTAQGMRTAQQGLSLATQAATASQAAFAAMLQTLHQVQQSGLPPTTAQLQQLAQTAAQSQQGLRSLGLGMATVQTGLTQTTPQIGLMTRLLGSLSGPIARVVTGFLAFSGIQAGIQGVLTVVSALVRQAVQMQSLTAAFVAISGSASAAATQMTFVRGVANSLGGDFASLARRFVGFQAAARGTNLEGQATSEIFRSIVTASRALQLTSGDTEAILLAIQQVMSKGKVGAEELRGQIGERLPGAMDLAARAMGVTTRELSKLIETTDLAASTFLPRFARQLQREYGGGAEIASKTFASAVARFKNAFTELGQAAERSGFLTWLGGVVDKLTAIIEKGPKAARELDEVAKKRTAETEKVAAPGGFTTEQRAQLNALNAAIERGQAALRETQQRQAQFPLREGDTAGGLSNIALQLEQQRQRQVAHLARLRREHEDLVRSFQPAGLEEFTPSQLRAQRGPVGTPVREQLDQMNKEVQSRVETFQTLWDRLQQRLTLAPTGENQLDILKEQFKELEKTIEDVQATYARSPVLKDLVAPSPGGAKRGPPAVLAEIERAAAAQKVPPRLVEAMAFVETGGTFRTDLTSPKGAQGLMQLMPDTARGYRVSDPFNIQENLRGGTEYLRDLLRAFPDNLAKVIQGYHQGLTAVREGRPAGPATQKYVRDVLAQLGALEGAPGIPAPLQRLLTQRQALADQIDEVDRQKVLGDIEEDRRKKVLDFAEELRVKTDAFGENWPERVRRFFEDFNRGLAQQEQITPDSGRWRLLMDRAEERQQLEVKERLREFRLADEEEIHRVITALRDEEEALKTNAAQRQINLLISRNAAPEILAEAEARLDNIAALEAERDAAATRGGQLESLEQLVQGYGDEIRAITLTREALLDLELTRLQASDGQRAFAQQMRVNAEWANRYAEFSQELTGTIEELAIGGGENLGKLGESFGRTIYRMITDALGLDKVLTNLLKTLLGAPGAQGQAGTGFLGWLQRLAGVAGAAAGGGGGGAAVGLTGAGASEVAAGVTGGVQAVPAFQHGGYAMPYRSYLVGERGPEFLHMGGMGGQVVPPGKTSPAAQRPIQVTMHVTGVSDASSFQRSSGEISARLLQAIRQAGRNS